MASADERILSALRVNPGQGFRALHRSTGLSHSTVMLHVRSLRRQGLVAGTRRGKWKRWHLAGEDLPPPPLHPVAERILDFVRSHPHARQVDILAALPDVPRSTVQWHLGKLVRTRRTPRDAGTS